MDITGMIAELRLELDRIERSILILDTLACSNRTKWATLLNQGGGSPSFGGKPATGGTGRVISIARGDSRPESDARSSEESEEEDLPRSLHELRSQTVKFQKAISTLVRKPSD